MGRSGRVHLISGGGGGVVVVEKRGSSDFSSAEVGISVRIEPSCINFYQLCFASDQGLL